jgi:hypothetical protein
VGSHGLQRVWRCLCYRQLQRRCVSIVMPRLLDAALRTTAGMVCTDAGITSGVIVSEYGYANFGAQYGGERTSWDLSHVGLNINLDTQLSSSDGQTVTCRGSNCPGDQAYNSATDYAADRNSPLGQTFTHTFCP